jgi:hypothetical protein
MVKHVEYSLGLMLSAPYPVPLRLWYRRGRGRGRSLEARGGRLSRLGPAASHPGCGVSGEHIPSAGPEHM